MTQTRADYRARIALGEPDVFVAEGRGVPSGSEPELKKRRLLGRADV